MPTIGNEKSIGEIMTEIYALANEIKDRAKIITPFESLYDVRPARSAYEIFCEENHGEGLDTKYPDDDMMRDLLDEDNVSRARDMNAAIAGGY